MGKASNPSGREEKVRSIGQVGLTAAASDCFLFLT